MAVARNPVRPGQPLVLSGRVARADGTAVAGAPVALQMAGGGGFATLATVNAAADGAWSAFLPARVGTYRALYAGDSAHVAAASPSLPVGVARS